MKIIKLIVCGIIFLPLNTVVTMELPEIRKKASELEEKQQKTLNWQLMRAISRDELEQVIDLIEAGAEINHVDPDLKTTPLYTAILFNNYAIMRYLLSHGADVRLGKSVLHAAILNDNFELVKYFGDLGASITEEDYNSARNRGNQDIIDYLKSMMPPKRK